MNPDSNYGIVKLMTIYIKTLTLQVERKEFGRSGQ